MVNMNAYESWVEFMMEYYMNIFPGHEEKIYRRWAVGSVDRAAVMLGDYFSRNYYDNRL
jgi:hypothetical protein